MGRYTTDEFVLKAKKVHGDNTFIYDKVIYINSNTKCEIGCPKHGYFVQIPKNHLFGHGCIECEKERRKNWNKEKNINIEEHIERCRNACNKNKLKFVGLTNYEKNKWMIKVQCMTCGYEYDVYFYDIERYSCIKCGYKRVSEFQKNTGLWKNNLKTHGEYKYLLASSKKYEGIEHESSYEKEIQQFISIFLDKDKIKICDRTVLYPYELDIYIPSLKLAIEFNGIYWHDKDNWENYKSIKECSYEECREQYKTLECNKKGIRLIHIWEDDWLENGEKILKNIEEEIKIWQEKM